MHIPAGTRLSTPGKLFFETVEEASILPGDREGEVDIRVTLTGGELPEQPFLDGLVEHLENRRPLTDRLTISPPDPVAYSIACTWYVSRSARGQLDEIRQRVQTAVGAYIVWQDGEIGRDISPDMLTKLLMQAGVKRAPVASPAFTPVNHRSICRHDSVDVVFGGIEDD